MKITLDIRKSAMENAQALFDEAKKFRRKAEGAKKAIENTKRKIALAQAPRKQESKSAAGRHKKKWFHEYRFFTTTNGLMCVGGKNAKQNDTLVAAQLKEGDLFFHADVHGASAVILKEGTTKAKEQDLLEAAQFAGSYSNAWKGGSGVADVYCVGKDQVSKHSHGEFVGKGAFLISGERKWFKNTLLEIALSDDENEAKAEPALKTQGKGIILKPGGETKEELYRQLKSQLKKSRVSTDEFFALVPGNSEIA